MLRTRGRHRALRVAMAAAGCLALLACTGPPRPIEYVGDGAEPDTADGLYRVRSTRVARVFLRPGTDFSAYRSVVIDPVTVSYGAAPRTADRRRRRGNEGLSPSEMERFKKIFQESFDRELGRSHYTVVSEPGPHVLRVSAHVLDLVVEAPAHRGAEEIDYILKAGEMTLLLNVNDSETGAPLARVADRRAIVPAGTASVSTYRSSPVSNWTAVREVFEDWARILRGGLDELRALPAVPLPAAPAPSEQ